MTDLIVMDNGEDGNTWTLLFIDQIDHKGAVGGVEGPGIRPGPFILRRHEVVAAVRGGSILRIWQAFHGMRSTT